MTNEGARINVHIPITTPDDRGFCERGPAQRHQLLGFECQVLETGDQRAIEIFDVPAEQADALVARVRDLVARAAVRFGFSIQVPASSAETSDMNVINGATVGYYPAGPVARPVYATARATLLEPAAFLFATMNEMAATAAGDGRLSLALSLFNTVDFEVGDQAKFLILTMVLEVLAERASRSSDALALVAGWEEQAKAMLEAAPTHARDDLEALVQGLAFQKQISIGQAIRALSRDAAKSAGRDEGAADRLARDLYGLRSRLIHGGKSVSGQQLSDLRALVRDVIAYRIGCGQLPDPLPALGGEAQMRHRAASWLTREKLASMGTKSG